MLQTLHYTMTYTATHYDTLQHTAGLFRTDVFVSDVIVVTGSVLQSVACCSVLQSVVCCSVLYVAVCCSLL